MKDLFIVYGSSETMKGKYSLLLLFLIVPASLLHKQNVCCHFESLQTTWRMRVFVLLVTLMRFTRLFTRKQVMLVLH